MAFIRLSDDYNDHPKFDNLSDGAFRLWHQGMGFCRKYQTDGLIPSASLRKFKAYSPKRMRELMTPWKDGANSLWHDVPGFGINVHDYLDWNLSKEEEEANRADARDRMRRRRSGDVRANNHPNSDRTIAEVLGTGRERIGSGVLERKKDDAINARSNRPIFSGQKLTIFEWMLDDCRKTLGNFAEAFDLHEWFFQLDGRALAANWVQPKRDSGEWLQQKLVAEALARGIPLDVSAKPAMGKQTTRLAQALANIKAEA